MRTIASKGLLLLGAGLTLFAGPADASTPITWYAARSPEARSNWLYGDTTCKRHDPDCNQCIDDIQGQFDRAFRDGRYSNEQKVWHFNWRSPYPPSDNKPDIAFDEAGAIQHLHVQGFARSNLDDFPFVVTHSDDHDGGMAVIRQIDGRKQLTALHETVHNHPSSVSTLGSYAVIIDGIRVRFYDLRDPHDDQEYRHKLPGPRPLDSDFNGGVAAVKLDGGGYLIMNTTGGSNQSKRYTDFYFMGGDLEAPERIEFLGGQYLPATVDEFLSMQPQPTLGYSRSDMILPENMSAMTECGTGDIYLAYMTGEGNVDSAFGESDADITLARVEWGDKGPKTTTIESYRFDQDMDDCFLRGGASFGSAPWDPHTLRFYCHERSVEVNVFQDAETFRYREIIVDP